jgi:hypothetical protein
MRSNNSAIVRLTGSSIGRSMFMRPAAGLARIETALAELGQ